MCIVLWHRRRAPRTTLTGEAPDSPRRDADRPQHGSPRVDVEQGEIADWPELIACLKKLRHSYVPGAVTIDYRMFLDRMLRRFNHASGHIRKDLALRTLIAGICVTTRDLYNREAGRRSIRSRAAKMRKRFKTALDGGVSSLLQEAQLAREEEQRRASPRLCQSCPSSLTVKKALRFAKVGEYRRAMRALLEGTAASSFDPVVQAGLEKLHPVPCEPVLPMDRLSLPPAYQCTPDIVSDIVSKLSLSSAPGPDGMTAQLLKPVLSGQDGPDIPDVDPLQQLTDFINTMLRGDISDSTAANFCSATLIGLDKPNGGVRPLAIGGLLRRVVAKVAMKLALDDARAYLMPTQIAVGASNGIDAAVHSLRATLDAHGNSDEYILVQIDASNAFNSCNRAMILREVVKHLPGLTRWTRASYGRETDLLCGDVVIKSRAGTQQGDPLGMLYFAIVLHPLLERARKLEGLSAEGPLQVWYADDGNIVGKVADVALILQFLLDEGAAYGFSVHPTKTKAWWPRMDIERLRGTSGHGSRFPCSLATSPDGTPLGGVIAMGSPLGSDAYCKEVALKAVSTSKQLLDAIGSIPNAQIGFHLHRLCATTPRVIHLMRTTPPHITDEMAAAMDSLSREGFCAINGFRPGDSSWSIACLPIRLGGLGITQCTPTQLPAFAGSLIDSAGLRAAMSLHTSVLATTSEEQEYSRAIGVLKDIETKHEIASGTLIAAELHEAGHSQSAVSQLVCHRLLSEVLPDVDDSDPLDRALRALLLGSASKGASSWLSALPLPTNNSPATNPTWRTQLMLRVRHAMPNYGETCPVCLKEPLDAFGHHAMTCAPGFGPTRRHKVVVEAFRHKVFRLAGMLTTREAPNLISGSDDRPADLYHEELDALGIPTRRTAYDVTVTSAFTKDNLRTKVDTGGQAAARAEAKKMVKYFARCAAQTPPVVFVPLAFDTTGAIGPATVKTLKLLARTASCHSSLSDAQALRSILTNISCALMKFVALQVMVRYHPQPVVSCLPPLG